MPHLCATCLLTGSQLARGGEEPSNMTWAVEIAIVVRNRHIEQFSQGQMCGGCGVLGAFHEPDEHVGDDDDEPLDYMDTIAVDDFMGDDFGGTRSGLNSSPAASEALDPVDAIKDLNLKVDPEAKPPTSWDRLLKD